MEYNFNRNQKECWSLAKKKGQYNGAKIVFSRNGAERTGHAHAKKGHTLYIIYKI